MYIKALEQDHHRFRKSLSKGRTYKPVFVKIKLLWDCNLRCKMCNHWRWRGAMLDRKILKKLIPDLAKLGCQRIHLSGGEPMMYPNLPQAVKWMRKQGIKVTLTTNATLFTEQKAVDMVNAGLKKVNISIDSPNPAIHDNIRGMQGAFERSVRGAEFLRQAFINKSGSGIPSGKIFLNMVINQANYRQVNQLPQLVDKIGARGFHLIPIYARNDELQSLNAEQIKEFNREVAPRTFEQAQQLGLEVTPDDIWVFGVSAQQIQSSAQGNYAADYYQHHPCYALWTHALIDHNGSVAPCCTLTNQVIIGSLATHSFKKIWQGEKFRELRKAASPIHEACNRCTMFLPKNKQIEHLLK
ncbi:radical SAM protein [Microscilla marina]|uniref:Elongator protein 3/MiaB/NifB, putative n=1 Tax=Microscilla marina ATCC 23134 TaxID=313606 RepID=A1ZFU8_MICM2|nr:radical SAM protein [Microscilla marina]EAY30872.1 elongator protein 3/MiaB/NifB, putative [Microscilla marina ATCC 23134]